MHRLTSDGNEAFSRAKGRHTSEIARLEAVVKRQADERDVLDDQLRLMSEQLERSKQMASNTEVCTAPELKESAPTQLHPHPPSLCVPWSSLKGQHLVRVSRVDSMRCF